MKAPSTFMHDTRSCNKCNSNEFYINQPYSCAPCARARTKVYIENNRESHMAKVKAWHKENSRYLAFYQSARYKSRKEGIAV